MENPFPIADDNPAKQSAVAQQSKWHNDVKNRNLTSLLREVENIGRL
jgi:hypothetical protein